MIRSSSSISTSFLLVIESASTACGFIAKRFSNHIRACDDTTVHELRHEYYDSSAHTWLECPTDRFRWIDGLTA